MINSNNNPYSLPSQYIIENDDILNIDFYGNKNKVGVTTKKYEELSNICDKYYNKLVELGAITPPKTQEQIIQEQTQLMHEMINQMAQMKQEIEVLKNAKSTNVITDNGAKSTTSEQTPTSVGTSKPNGTKR
jgi:hypothetical protein